MSYTFKEVETQLREASIKYGETDHKLKFIIDAQLPKRLSDFLNANDYYSIHTLDLPNKNATPDNFIKEKAFQENFILITKDDDFLRSFLIEKKPSKLILVKTGNINNNTLLEIFSKGLNVIIQLIEHHNMIAITNEEIVVHD